MEIRYHHPFTEMDPSAIGAYLPRLHYSKTPIYRVHLLPPNRA